MEGQTAARLIELNNRFYAREAASFSKTRQAPWPGWQRCLKLFDSVQIGEAPSVFDIGCGNLRFENYLARSFPREQFAFYALDSCEALLPDDRPEHLHYLHRDILSELLEGKETNLAVPPCFVSVCFGFMHHVPSANLRRNVLDVLMRYTQKGGFICVNFWQFGQDEVARRTAEETSQRALTQFGFTDLDAGDYFLGWQHDEAVYRYCHSFSDEEIKELIAPCEKHAQIFSSYKADGRGQKQNAYLILQKRL